MLQMMVYKALWERLVDAGDEAVVVYAWKRVTVRKTDGAFVVDGDPIYAFPSLMALAAWLAEQGNIYGVEPKDDNEQEAVNGDGEDA